MEADAGATGAMPAGERTLDAAPAGSPVPPEAPEAIVAIGASAGGLEAIEQFFGAVEVPSRLAFVIVQHLSPDLKSLMGELLSRRTTLALPQVVDGMRPAPNAIYLIPPGKTMTIEGGALSLADRDARDFAYHPIDEFFLSLAADQGAASIGVVLSGSGSDGSRGARAILRAGGRVLVQAPATAKFSSMPKAALDAGCTSDVMPPEAMPRALLDVELRPRSERGTPAEHSLPARLVETLDATFGIDLARYRAGIVQRRVRRRMMLRGFDQIEDYAELVTDDEDEQEALYQDLLIGGTTFLRDGEVLEALERLIVPALAAELDAGREVRIWVPAVATGEEAYAIAIMILAQCQRAAADLPGDPSGDPRGDPPLRIFATDVHRRSLAVAAAGHYSEEALRDVRPAWLERFFSRRGSGYQVIPALRRCIVFSPHDLLQDPPFTRLQLVICRNLLPCLGKGAQDDVLRSFATALEADGHLLLGPSERLGAVEGEFEAVAPGFSLYRRRPGGTSLGRPPLVSSVLAGGQPGGRHTAVPSGGPTRPERRDHRLTMAHELLLDRYVPPSLLVDSAGLVVHCFGDAGAYLRQPRGRPSLAVLEMIVEPLRGPLGSAMSRVRRTGRPVTLSHVAAGDDHVLQRLVVETLPTPGDAKGCLLVSFDDRRSPAGPVEDEAADEPEAGDAGATPEPESPAASEELRAANLALQSALDELRAANEELQAEGAEQERRIAALVQGGQDMESLVGSAELAALLVDADLRVRRFTPALGRFFNLLTQDVGRPLAHLTHGFGDADIVGRLRDVTATGDIVSADLVAADGALVRLRAVPHRDRDGKVTGVAATFVDVTESLRQAEALVRARSEAAVLLEALPLPAALADGNGRLTAANVWMEEAACAAGLAPDLTGRELDWLLAPFLAGPARAELGRRLRAAADWRHREATAGGATLSVELRSASGQTVALVLLEAAAESAVAPPAARC